MIDKQTQQLLDGPLEGRVAWVQSDHWVTTRYARRAIQWMEYFYRSARRDRPACLQIVAQPGMGKTALLNEFHTLHPPYASPHECRLQRPVLLASASLEEPSVDGLHRCLMKAAWPEASHKEVVYSEDECDETLHCQGVREILLDEVGDLLNCGATTHKRILAEIKRISNQLRINFVCSTIENMAHALRADEQLSSRFKHVIRIGIWVESQDFRDFLFGLEQYLPFPEPSHLDQREIVRWLLLKSGGNTENTVDLIRMAALFALQDESRMVTKEHFDLAADSDLPPEVGLRWTA